MSSDAVVNLIVNAADAESQVNVQLRRIVNDAERRAPDISLQVNIDMDRVNRTLTRELNILGTRIDGAIGHLGDRFEDLNNQISADLRASLQGLRDDLQRLDTGSSSSITNITNNFAGMRDDVDDTDRSVRSLSGTFTGLAGGIGRAVASSTRLVAIGGVASQAIPLVAGLVTAIESIVPAAAAGVSAFVTMKAAALTLKLGLTGVQDAITAVFDPDADPEKVAEALDKLSDNARDFVLELQKMKPAFDKLRLDVQDRLFKGLDDQLKSVAKSTFPELRTAARDFADTFNSMAKGVASGARELGDNGTLGQALTQGTTAFSKLERIPGQVLVAVTQLAAAGGPLLNRFTDKIVDLADSASKALEGAFESGALEDAVNAAGDTIAQLGRIAGNVFGILGNLMDAAGESGTGLFGTLEQVTQALEDLTGTTEFQETLGALIEVGSTLVEAVLPLLEEAFLALAPAIQILAPYVQDIIELLGDQLAELIPELAPVLADLALLFGEILVAITPLIEQGINVLIDLMPSLLPLFDALVVLVQDLAPLIEYFAVGTKELLVPALQFALEAVTYFIIGLDGLVQGVEIVIEWLGKFVLELTDQTDPGIRATTQLLNGDFSGAWDTAARAIADMTAKGLHYVFDFATRSSAYLSDLALRGAAYIVSGFNQIAAWIARKTSEAVGYVIGMRDRIVAIALGIASDLYNAGVSMMRSLINGMLSQLGSAISAANSVVGAIRDFFPSSPAKRGPFSGRGYPFYSGQEVVNSFTRGIESRTSAARRAVMGTLGGALIPSSGGANPLSGIVSGGTEFAGIANTTFARLTPNVNVMVQLGNDQLVPYFQTVVDEDTVQRDRLAAQGARS